MSCAECFAAMLMGGDGGWGDQVERWEKLGLRGGGGSLKRKHMKRCPQPQ